MTQSGRSILEIISVLAIIGVLSVAGVLGFSHAMNKKKVNDILHEIHQKSLVISAALNNKTFSNPQVFNSFLKQFDSTVDGYQVHYVFPEDGNLVYKNYAIKIMQKDDKPVRGKMCRELMRSMMKQKIITDIGITIKDDEDGDGVEDTVSLRLNGLSVDLDALCGKDIL